MNKQKKSNNIRIFRFNRFELFSDLQRSPCIFPSLELRALNFYSLFCWKKSLKFFFCPFRVHWTSTIHFFEILKSLAFFSDFQFDQHFFLHQKSPCRQCFLELPYFSLKIHPFRYFQGTVNASRISIY